MGLALVNGIIFTTDPARYKAEQGPSSHPDPPKGSS